MLLAIDIGNTDTVFGIYSENKWIHQFRIPTYFSNRAEDIEARLRLRFLENNLRINYISEIVISCVVPDMLVVLEQLSLEMFGVKPIIIYPDIYPMLNMKIPQPYEIGTDLVSNAVYAFHKYKGKCIVVDFGTALTFTLISEKGIEGVSIAPGLKTAVKSLFTNTAQLPEVPLEMPKSAIGKDTVSAIQAGILWGYVGMVKEMIYQIKQEFGDCTVLATGGLSSILTPLQNEFQEVDKLLTLNGMKIIADIAQKKKKTRAKKVKSA